MFMFRVRRTAERRAPRKGLDNYRPLGDAVQVRGCIASEPIMFIPPGEIEDSLDCDVAVVGAGPSGMALAMDLARAGTEVVLLPGGTLGPDTLSRDLAGAVALPPFHADPSLSEGRRFGGMSWSWGGRCVPLDPGDFEARPALGLPGWPISRDDLLSRADEAADFLGIGSAAFEADDYSAFPGLTAALERWCAQPRLVERHREAFRREPRVKVLLGATCTGAGLSRSAVDRLEATGLDGRKITVRARHSVLAAGGIEIARLLLWFYERNGRRAPHWTGRGYMGHLKGQILSYAPRPAFFDALDYRRTPECYVRSRLALTEADVETHRLRNIAFHLDNPPMTDPSHGSAGLSAAAMGLSMPWLGSRTLAGPMRRYFLSDGIGGGALLRHGWNVARRPLAAQRFVRAALRGRAEVPCLPGVLDREAPILALTFNAEQQPDERNRIGLTDERDRCGVPRVAITRTLSDDEVDGVIRAHRVLSERLAAAGAGSTAFLAQDAEGLRDAIRRASGDGFHQIGVARMGDDPATSVTDADARVHGLDNLYIAGSAVFPRSGQAHPTFNAVCQSLRLSRHIRSRCGLP
jgi:GMC oxidoreductase/FAD binding domain